MKDRILTFDEQKAAEAAFNGYAFDASWSPSAQRVYEGIIEALANRVVKQSEADLQPA